jgi:hypothetical protein
MMNAVLNSTVLMQSSATCVTYQCYDLLLAAAAAAAVTVTVAAVALAAAAAVTPL